jgi:SWI/SNF-related matrix-associated actin-dependent regulator of chromatin subfamily A-like protein 1
VFNLNDINTIKALGFLNKYEGKNPYLKKLKRKHFRGGVNLTETQARYIIDYHDKDPHLINRPIEITEYFGEELQKQHNLKIVPTRILFQFILAETEKAYHIYGKLKRNQKHSDMYWVPKTQVLEDPYWQEPEIEVDFDKYVKMDSKGRFPYNHQETGIKFLLTRNGCILADDMGLGKTYQSSVAALEMDAKKVLIICPSAMKIGWQRELECFGQETSIISGKEWNPAKFTIINFDILKNFHTPKEKRTKKYVEEGNIINNHIIEEQFDLVIVDEAHNLKNHKSIRGKIVKEICVDFGNPRTWLLTGTPVANRPMDFYNLLKIINSPITKNLKHYVLRYCDGKIFNKKLKNGKVKQIWITDGASNLEELSLRVRNLLLRRKKENVLDMPDKTITPLYHDLTAKQIIKYENLWDEYMEDRKAKKKKGRVDRDLVELGLLRQFIANETIEHSMELINSALEQDQKVIVFTNYNEEQDIIAEKLGNIAVRHNGSMSDIEKQVSVDRFQEDDKVKVFIGNIKSAGVGITLTAATVVVFNSLDWVPGNILQAIDRAYRIGQKNNVSVYFNIFRNTIDARVWESLFDKSEIIETILDGNSENIFSDKDASKAIDDINNLIDGESNQYKLL